MQTECVFCGRKVDIGAGKSQVECPECGELVCSDSESFIRPWE